MIQQLKELRRDFVGLEADDLDTASIAVSRLRGSAEAEVTASIAPMWVGILDVIGRVIVFTRTEFFKDGKPSIPKAINLIKWIRIVAFFVRMVKDVIAVTKR